MRGGGRGGHGGRGARSGRGKPAGGGRGGKTSAHEANSSAPKRRLNQRKEEKKQPTYGAMSKKQKEFLHEYGELNPGGDEEEDVDQVNTDLSEFIARKRRRVITEEQLDAEQNSDDGNERLETVAAYNEGDNGSWTKPRAYNRLVKLLRKGSSNKDLYERRRIEERGLEDMDEEDDDDDEDAEEGGKVLELTEEEAIAYREKHGDLLEEYKSSGDESDAEEGNENENDGENSQEQTDDENISQADNSENEEDEAADEGFQSLEDDGGDVTESTDPFELHFGDKRISNFASKVAITEDRSWTTSAQEDQSLGHYSLLECEPTTSVSKEKSRVAASVRATLDDLLVKKRLQQPWLKHYSAESSTTTGFSPLQASLFSQINEYRDVLFTDRTMVNATEIMQCYCLHALNHVNKTRDRILKNSAKITALQAQDKDCSDIRDQGYTRPKVLIVVPFRNTAKKIVDALIKISACEQVEKRKRFFDEYSPEDGDEDERDPTKPPDYWDAFDGNVDDHFKIGIKLTRKTMKLYSDFYSSDILIASPLALKMVIGEESDKKRDFDFLSSIELLIMDQSDVFLMQNWDHVETVFSHLNLIPKQGRDCDFSRVRGYYLDGQAGYLRQSLLFSGFNTPEINAIFNSRLKNVGGKIKTRRTYEGSLLDVIPQVKQVFTRIDPHSHSELDDFRFKHFTEKTLPALCHSSLSQAHTLIFIPSYFDFVRVRNYFLSKDMSFGQLSEYTSKTEMSRSRGDFFEGRRKFLLVTERFHFFRRYKLRGARRIIFYAPPDHPQFYNEIVDFLALPMSRKRLGSGGGEGGGGGGGDGPGEDGNAGSGGAVGVIYTKYDRLRMERIVGTSRVGKMCAGDKSVFMFA